MEKEEKRLNHLLAEYTPDKYEQNRIYIQQDQNKFKVVCNPVTATTATYMYTKKQILQELDSIYRLIEDLKDEEYHMVKGDVEKDGFIDILPSFKKNKYKHKKSHKKLSKRGRSPKKASKSPKKTLKSPKKTSKSPKKTSKSPKKASKSPKKTSIAQTQLSTL